MQCTHSNTKWVCEGWTKCQCHVIHKKMLNSFSTLSGTQRISCWFSMAELLIHLQGHVAQTNTLILIRHFSSLGTCQSATGQFFVCPW